MILDPAHQEGYLWLTLCIGIPVADLLKDVVKTTIIVIKRNAVGDYLMAEQQRKRVDSKTWKKRDGTLMLLTDMDDAHLANTIRMVARNCNKESYLGDMADDSSFKKLLAECRRRKFQVTILNTPITIDGRKEYVDVFIPTQSPVMKVAASILLSDWDSRSEE